MKAEPKEPRYRLEHGSYYLTNGDENRILLMTDQVAIGYSRDSSGAILHKHGSERGVREWLRVARARLVEGGNLEMANEFEMMVLPAGFEVDEINRCLSTSGYIGVLLARIEREAQPVTLSELEVARVRIADLEKYVGEHLTAMGPCEDSAHGDDPDAPVDPRGNESLCDVPSCTYCQLARALQPTICGSPLPREDDDAAHTG